MVTINTLLDTYVNNISAQNSMLLAVMALIICVTLFLCAMAVKLLCRIECSIWYEGTVDYDKKKVGKYTITYTNADWVKDHYADLVSQYNKLHSNDK